MSEFKDKVVVITGGNGGIGKETARLFLREGAKVYILGRNESTLNETLNELNIHDGQLLYMVCNVDDITNCSDVISSIGECEGQIDILINSAGKYVETSIDEVNEDEFNETFNTNVRGTFFMCKYAVPYLKKSKGCIVNVGSTAGIVGFGDNTLYCATKGALNAFTRALAVELASFGIRVNIVCPDMVKTKMLDIGFKRSGIKNRADYDNYRLNQYPQSLEDKRFVLPEEVAECILFLASNKRVWAVTGSSLTIDLGLTAGFC